jgi:hypothetical protein
MVPGERYDDAGGLIPRAVVHDDQLEAAEYPIAATVA